MRWLEKHKGRLNPYTFMLCGWLIYPIKFGVDFMTKNEAAKILSEIITRLGFIAEIGEYGLPEIPVVDKSFIAVYIQPKWDEAENGFIFSVRQGIRRTSSDLSSEEMRIAADEIARAADVVDEINAAHIIFDNLR